MVSLDEPGVLQRIESLATKIVTSYRGADKSLARPGGKQRQKYVRDAHDFNNIETLAVLKIFFFLQDKAPKEIHAILTETLTCFLPGRAKDLSAPLYKQRKEWSRKNETVLATPAVW